jgi:DNA-binding response OmpR family regulator
MNTPTLPTAPESVDVVVLAAPAGRHLPEEFLRTVVRLRRVREHLALLVVLAHSPESDEAVASLIAAGADDCVVAPSPSELFRCIERVRTLRRRALEHGHEPAEPETTNAADALLDALWRTRAHAAVA